MIILGFDGMDSEIAADGLRGEKPAYPFLAELARKGTFEPLATSNPAQSPVSWACMNTGANPGKTGVTGFVERGFSKARADSPYAETPHPILGLTHRKKVGPEAISPWLAPDRIGLLALACALVPVLVLAVLDVLLGMLRGRRRRRGFSLGWVLGLIAGVELFYLMAWPDRDPGRSALWGLGLFLVLGGSLRLLIGRRLVFGRFTTLGVLLGSFLGTGVWFLRSELPGRIIPSADNVVQADPFWKTTAEHGVQMMGHQVAMTFPVKGYPHTEILSGLGVPCARQSFGDWFIYDESRSERSQTATAGFVEPLIAIERDAKGALFRTKLYGPQNFFVRAELLERIEALRAEILEKEKYRPAGYKESLAHRDLLERLSKRYSELVAEYGDDAHTRVAVDLTIRIPAPPSLAAEVTAALREIHEGAGEQALGKATNDEVGRRLAELARGAEDPWGAMDHAAWLRSSLEELARGDKRSRELRDKLDTPAVRALLSALDALKADASRAATVAIQGRSQRMAAGVWAPDFYKVRFVFKELMGLPAFKSDSICRAKVMRLYPLKLYIGPLNLDPSSQPPHLDVSAPRRFGSDLVEMLGRPFETMGWACATHPLKDMMIDEQTFLEDIELKWAQRRELLIKMLEQRPDVRVLFFIFGETDRVQHMMFRYLDKRHPRYAEDTASLPQVKFFGRMIAPRDAIKVMYQEVDDVCREVYERFVAPDPNATLMVVSDHGFSSFRRQFHLPNWLYENGYLKIHKDKERLFKRDARAISLMTGDSVLSYIDWGRTRAYSIGLGKIFINRADREHWTDRDGATHRGIVTAEEYDDLVDEIIAKLVAERDADGEPVLRTVYRASDIYRGDKWQDRADLYLGFQYGYRISWQATLGSFGLASSAQGPIFAVPLGDNDLKWSGDHCSVDPGWVNGIFFSNRRFAVSDDDLSYEKPPRKEHLNDVDQAEKAPGRVYRNPLARGRFSVLHIAPTTLSLVGLEPPEQMDRKPLVLR